MLGGGIIRNVSMIERGEALGHEGWIDHVFLKQVCDAVNNLDGQEKRRNGLKSRHSHPSESADGTGRLLGRFVGPARIENDKVIADLHIAKAAHKSPEGNLANYYFELADSSPEDIGASIVFRHDHDAEREFYRENYAEGLGFVSPDKDNENNYPHCRLSTLKACDMVDDPAANSGGMFSTKFDEIPEAADRFMAYLIGSESEEPESSMFGVDAGRARAYVARYLDRHGLTIVEKENEEMSKETTTDTPQKSEEQIRSEYRSELKKYSDTFGADRGVKYFNENKTWTEALEADREELKKQLAAKDAEIEELGEKLEAAKENLGEESGAEFSESGSDKKSFIKVH